MRHIEAQSQRAVIEWWAFACHLFKVPEHLLASFPNGGRRGIREAVLMKKEGCRKGAPDLILMVPRGQYHGMFLEMKAPGGRLSPEQNQFLFDLSAQGYWVMVSYSTEAAITELTHYMRRQTVTGVTSSVSLPAAPASPSRRSRKPRVPVLPPESSVQWERQVFCEAHPDA